ncbi:ATP-binding protein [Roseovarius sp.]|uniref:ATP-binding protein n=1 Tax=Roseovarius sp. TaxID=1486281 RepID=UPI0025E4DF66|nr:ATP-binding protein [Roseovarius sp.]
MVIPDTPPQHLDLTTVASDLAVRDLLTRTRDWLRAHALPDETCGTVELVLAEALNNIVEHAYPPDAPGAIRLALQHGPTHLVCILSDHGTALPGGVLPDGTLPDHDVARDALPEGGFGWFLIRDLTDRLDYRRDAGWSHLTLEFHLPAL